MSFPRSSLADRDWLIEQYVVRGRTIAEIATSVDPPVTVGAVHQRLIRFDIPRRRRGRRHEFRLAGTSSEVQSDATPGT